MDIERRLLTAKIELRKAANTSPPTLRGYAARFNSLSENLGGFREQISPGAFSDVLDDDVRCLFNHDSNLILGRTISGTCRIGQDDAGLWYEVDLPDTQTARDLAVAIDRGDVNQSSFGFRIAVDGAQWDENDDGVYIRTIKRVGRLYDVSPVTLPAYPEASVGMRSLDAWRTEKGAQTAQVQAHIRRQVAARTRALRLLA